MRNELRTTSGNDAPLKPSTQGILIADAVPECEMLSKETFGVEMAKVAAWTNEDIRSDSWRLRMKTFHEMLVKAKYTESEFKEHIGQFLQRAYPRWMPKDFFMTERAKLYGYHWYLEQSQKGNAHDIEGWLLPSGFIGYKHADGVDVPHATQIIGANTWLETPEALEARKQLSKPTESK